MDFNFFIRYFVKKLVPKFLPDKLEKLRKWCETENRVLIIVPNQNGKLCLINMELSQDIKTAIETNLPLQKGVQVYDDTHLFTFLMGVENENLDIEE